MGELPNDQWPFLGSFGIFLSCSYVNVSYAQRDDANLMHSATIMIQRYLMNSIWLRNIDERRILWERPSSLSGPPSHSSSTGAKRFVVLFSVSKGSSCFWGGDYHILESFFVDISSHLACRITVHIDEFLFMIRRITQKLFTPLAPSPSLPPSLPPPLRTFPCFEVRPPCLK